MIVRVRGRSMSPTLHPGDFLWVRKMNTFRRGLVALIRQGEAELHLKRIIGMPGESVEIRAGGVRIGGQALTEPYVPEASRLQPQPDRSWALGAEECFVMGDARDDSLDSRRLGPVAVRQIVGVAVCRLWPAPMKRLLTLFFLLAACPVLHAAESGRLLAFAVDNQLTLALGRYEPGHRWVRSVDFYAPPQPGDVFTLYSPTGKVAEVTIQEKRSPVQDGTFAGWTAHVSEWNSDTNHFALAVAGSAPLAAVTLVPISPDNPEPLAIVSKYLKSRGLHVDQPFLTQAFQIPLEGQGRAEAVLLAHSDASALTAEQEAAVYAVALLWWNDHGNEKILPLSSQTSFKPAGRTREAHEHFYGTRDFLRLAAAVDIDGDGWKEIVLYDAKDDATQVDVFSFNGRRVKKVLSAYKPNYN